MEACKPAHFRNVNVVANQANQGIQTLPEMRPIRPRRPGPGGELVQYGGEGGAGVRGGGRPDRGPRGGPAPSFADASLLEAVGQADGRYGF